MLHIIRCIFPLIVLLLTALVYHPCAQAGEEEVWDGPFFFVHMSDTQLGMRGFNLTTKLDATRFEKAIEKVNLLKPAFVVITGDLINAPRSDRQLKEFWRVAKLLDKTIPLYLIPGNHDLGNKPTIDGLEWYRQNVGRDWYSFRYGGCQFIMLNSTIMKAPAGVREETAKQRKWLKSTLELEGPKSPVHTFIVQHHPLYVDERDERHDKWNLPEDIRRENLNSFKKHQVSAVLSGHLHRNHIAQDGDLLMISAAPAGSGFRIVKVFRDRIDHEYYGSDEIPGSIKLR